MILDEDRRVLLLHYVTPDTGEDFWGTPGGAMAHGESPLEAARRELREELGINAVVGDVLIGASVLCFLVLLALLADRLGSHLWHGSGERTFYRCESCDLRYLRRELTDPRTQVCPEGHRVFEETRSATAGLVTIFVCLGFLAAALLLVLTGAIPEIR